MSRTRASLLSRSNLCTAALLLLGLADPCPAMAMAADTDVEQDRYGNRIENFEPVPNADPATTPSNARCTADRRWCAEIRHGDPETAPLLVLSDRTNPVETKEIARYALPLADEQADVDLWSRIVRLPESTEHAGQRAMIGVVTGLHAMYSGGGAHAERLSLIQVSMEYGSTMIREVLSVPLNGSALIRACFSEADQEHRAGACHDEYNFAATLTLREIKTRHAATPGALPQFDYVTAATSFPGPVSRDKDSLANPPLTEKDLVHAVNDECSYRRVVRFNPATERYEFDSPAPDCSAFTVP